MAFGDHVSRVNKMRGLIRTVDPTTGIIEITGTDRQTRRIALPDAPVGFVWPRVDEEWVMREENGRWTLDGRAVRPEEAEVRAQLDPGDAVMGGEHTYEPSGRRYVTVDTTDLPDQGLLRYHETTDSFAIEVDEAVVGTTMRGVLTSTVNPAVPGIVVFNSVSPSDGGYGPAWLNVNNGYIVPPWPGHYHVSAQLMPQNTATDVQHFQAHLYKNDIDVATRWAHSPTGQRQAVQVQDTFRMNGIADHISVLRSSNYANTTISADPRYTYVSVTYLGPL